MLLSAWALAADWPYWRGSAHNGTTPEVSGWPRAGWPGEPAWVKPVGAGPTSPVVAGGRVYTMGWQNGFDSVYCLDAVSGQELWRQSYKCPEYPRFHAGDEIYFSGPLSTPFYDAASGLLFTLSSDSDLCCWDTRASGKSVWRMDLYDTYKAPQRPDAGGGVRDHGYTTSPYVLGDKVIVEVGAPEGNLMAFDKRTGMRRWVSQCKDPAGNSGGMAPITVGGIPCLALTTIRELVVVRTDRGHEGETAAAYPWPMEYGSTVPTPTVVGDRVILTNGMNLSRTECLRVTLGAVTKLWASREFARVCSPTVYKGRVYIAEGPLKCLDLATGQTKWTGCQCGEGGACFTTGDDKLIVFADRKLVLVDISASAGDAYKELAMRPCVGAKYCWPHPALAGGRLYTKDDTNKLSCFALGK
jgi:outer membrane protein assembly factor BamB